MQRRGPRVLFDHALRSPRAEIRSLRTSTHGARRPGSRPPAWNHRLERLQLRLLTLLSSDPLQDVIVLPTCRGLRTRNFESHLASGFLDDFVLYTRLYPLEKASKSRCRHRRGAIADISADLISHLHSFQAETLVISHYADFNSSMGSGACGDVRKWTLHNCGGCTSPTSGPRATSTVRAQAC